jgi:Kef-type K+ transport system membrane component KefB
MATILVAPLLFQRLRIPGLLGLICAGALIGPSMLGLLARDGTIILLGTVGLIYLMFVAGLSMDMVGFQKVRKKSLAFGAASFLIPLLLALLAGPTLLDFGLSATLLLASIVGSHTLLAYPIVTRIGITKNRAVTICMGGTLVTDVVSLGLLAVVIGAAGGETGPGYWGRFLFGVALFVTGAIIALPRIGRWFFRNVKYDSTTDWVFMVTVLFATASLAEMAGLAPIIGAFLAGLLMNSLVPESSTLMSRLQFVGNSLLIPFFLISVGMLVDVSVLAHGEVWYHAAILSGLVVIGKGGSAQLAGKLFGFTRAERWVMSGLTIPQAAATLAVTLIGFEQGFFGGTTVNAVVLTILVTCLLGPLLVERYGRDVALQDEALPYDPNMAPQRILVPLANPETATYLMDIALLVHDSASGEPLYPLTVTPDGDDVAARVASSEKMLQEAARVAADAATTTVPVTRIDLNVAKGIRRAIKERRISAVIIGWNGEVSTRRAIFGSILDQLLEDTEVLTMVCKLVRPINLYQRVIVALPPLASLEAGFPEAMRSVKLLAGQLGGSCLFVSGQESEAHLREKAESVSPVLDATWTTLDDWDDLENWLLMNRMADDLLVLISSRSGAVSWRPTLNRLPQKLAGSLTDLCLVVVYPAELEWAHSLPVTLVGASSHDEA